MNNHVHSAVWVRSRGRAHERTHFIPWDGLYAGRNCVVTATKHALFTIQWPFQHIAMYQKALCIITWFIQVSGQIFRSGTRTDTFHSLRRSQCSGFGWCKGYKTCLYQDLTTFSTHCNGPKGLCISACRLHLAVRVRSQKFHSLRRSLCDKGYKTCLFHQINPFST